jgi:gliding motility-associated-like protein
MFRLIVLIFSLVSLTSLSQQTIEVCPGESEATTYWVETDTPGEIIWSVNGLTYYTEQLEINWAQPGTYTISVTQTNGPCQDIEYFTVQVNSCDEILYYVPNSFTPDGDEFNNVFQPVFTSGFDASNFHLSIYNRWGELIFESYDASKGWDGYYNGVLCQDGVYTWKIIFKLPDTDERRILMGHVVLIR